MTSTPQRQGIVRFAPVAVLLALVGVSVATFVVTRRVIDDQEHRLLAERRAEIAVVVQSSITGAESSLRVLAGVGPRPGATDDLFERSAQPLMRGSTLSVGAAEPADDGSLDVVAGVGSARAGQTLTGERAVLVTRALEEGQLASGVVTDGDARALFIVVPAATGVRAVAFQESALTRDPVPPSPGSPFGETRAVLYASSTPDPGAIVLTTERDHAAIDGGSAEVLDVGSDHWLLVVGSRSPLVGTFAHRAPWLLLAGGLVSAAIAAAFAETLRRRRAYVLALVEWRTGELREALDELHTARTFLERLLDAGPVVVGRSAFPFAQLSYVSPNIERLFGYTVDEARAVGFLSEHVHPEDRADLEAALDRLGDPDTRQSSAQVRLCRRDGSERWVSIAFVAEAGDVTAPGAVVSYIIDVDDHRRLEQAQRTAQEIAESASRSKSDFLSRMSHELRTPLNAVIGFAQLLEMDELTVNQRDSVKQIVRGGEHLLDLINEVLDIARIETGRLRVSLEPVRLDDVVNEAIDLVRPLALARGISFPYRLPVACHRYVHGDRQRLKQVLLNLLGNAVKYNRDHGRVELVCDVQEGGRVRLGVTDTGPGIAAEKLAMVFTPFERLGAESSNIEGTGLGLALARGLAHAMGGELGVDSEPGVGSTFWIELEPAVAPDETIDVTQEPAARTGSQLSHTVLYIEDNLSNVRLVERILSHRPHIRAIVAMQGQMGIELARQHRPDLVLLDLNLPDMDGEEVLARLRAEPSSRDVPIVIVSADATAKQIARLRASGASDYLTKPLDVARFLRVVDSLLGVAPPAERVVGQGDTRRDGRGGNLDVDVLRGLHELVGGGAGLEDLATTFVEESTARLDSLRAAVEQLDRPAIRDVAHSLKGIAGTFGDVAVMRICTSLQEHASVGDAEILRQLVEDLAVTLRSSYRELDRFLAAPDNGAI